MVRRENTGMYVKIRDATGFELLTSLCECFRSTKTIILKGWMGLEEVTFLKRMRCLWLPF